MSDGIVWQEENAHAQRLLEEPCHFCWQRTTHLWYDPSRDLEPYQVRCLTCEAAGPWCDCGDESAVPTWLRPYELLDARDAKIAALRAENVELKANVVTFLAPWAVRYAKDFGLDGLHPKHYDMLEKCGARMVDFKRAALEMSMLEKKP